MLGVLVVRVAPPHLAAPASLLVAVPDAAISLHRPALEAPLVEFADWERVQGQVHLERLQQRLHRHSPHHHVARQQTHQETISRFFASTSSDAHRKASNSTPLPPWMCAVCTYINVAAHYLA